MNVAGRQQPAFVLFGHQPIVAIAIDRHAIQLVVQPETRVVHRGRIDLLHRTRQMFQSLEARLPSACPRVASHGVGDRDELETHAAAGGLAEQEVAHALGHAITHEIPLREVARRDAVQLLELRAIEGPEPPNGQLLTRCRTTLAATVDRAGEPRPGLHGPFVVFRDHREVDVATVCRIRHAAQGGDPFGDLVAHDLDAREFHELFNFQRRATHVHACEALLERFETKQDTRGQCSVEDVASDSIVDREGFQILCRQRSIDTALHQSGFRDVELPASDLDVRHATGPVAANEAEVKIFRRHGTPCCCPGNSVESIRKFRWFSWC